MIKKMRFLYYFFQGGPGYRQWTKRECDDAFYRDLKKICDKVNGGLECYLWADIYGNAVGGNLFGISGKAWNTPYCEKACRPSEGDPNTVLKL